MNIIMNLFMCFWSFVFLLWFINTNILTYRKYIRLLISYYFWELFISPGYNLFFWHTSCQCFLPLYGLCFLKAFQKTKFVTLMKYYLSSPKKGNNFDIIYPQILLVEHNRSIFLTELVYIGWGICSLQLLRDPQSKSFTLTLTQPLSLQQW